MARRRMQAGIADLLRHLLTYKVTHRPLVQPKPQTQDKKVMYFTLFG